MCCIKCGVQLTGGTAASAGCGCPTEFYRKPSASVRINDDRNVLYLAVFPIIIALLHLLHALLFFLFIPHIADVPYEVFKIVIAIGDLFNVIQPVLLIIFCLSNLKLPSKLARGSLIAMSVSQILKILVLLQSKLLYHWVTDVQAFSLGLSVQSVLFNSVFFISVGIFLIALNDIVSLTSLQRVMRMTGIILAFSHTAWILLVRLPFQLLHYFGDSLAGRNPLLQVCYDLYQLFAAILQKGLILSLIGSVIYLVITIAFYRTEKIEV